MRRRDLLRAGGAALPWGAVWSALVERRAAAQEETARPGALRLPEGTIPEVGCWFWTEREFEPGGYREFVDLVAAHAPYRLLTTSIRAPGVEVTDPAVHDQIKAAAEYARDRGLGIVMDLDVRLARVAFRERYPDELQQMLRLRVADLGAEPVLVRVPSAELSDHYTFRTTPYIALKGRFIRAYAYTRGPQGVEPETVVDLSDRCTVAAATPGEVAVELPADPALAGRQACVAVAFTHLTPDVFAPHLLEFQRELLWQYADVPLAGVCKDEWGFPPCFDGCPAKDDYWYSTAHAAAYADRAGGQDLVRDALLMHAGDRGREREREAAVNQLMRLAWERNGEIEADFHRATKAVFGPQAISATHPTWYPYPGVQEFMKNGLDWWVAPRDWAQTDEVTPYCARTALSRKWESPVWLNMYYSPQVADYEREVWSDALSGGRVNYHPLYPSEGRLANYAGLLGGDLMRGECRVRLLNLIVRAPLDCPVAVLFGHACAMNWAGPHYNDVGLALTDALWCEGFPTDLIPSDEVLRGALALDDEGFARYGPQRYLALVLYHPEYEPSELAEFAVRADGAGRTLVCRVGEWTKGFAAEPFDGGAALGGIATCPEAAQAAAAVMDHLRAAGVAPQARATMLDTWGWRTAVPPRSGEARLLDGTHVIIAASDSAAGDPIRGAYRLAGQRVTLDAVGLVAARCAPNGELQALAAGGLRRFDSRRFRLELDAPLDLALWRDGAGRLHGAVQDLVGPLPAALTALTDDWLRLAIPPPPPPPL